jgi:hypothetical protein
MDKKTKCCCAKSSTVNLASIGLNSAMNNMLVYMLP